MKNLQSILIQFAEMQMNRAAMKLIKGGYGGIGDSCTARCPSSSTGDSVTCTCSAGQTCFANDDIGCGCNNLGLWEQSCDA
jgi:hypothetical protein